MKTLLPFLCLWVQAGFAQTHQIDSLKQELVSLHQQPDKYTKDTLIYNTLSHLIRDYANVNVDSSLHYNALLIRICEDQKMQRELIGVYQYAGYLYQIKGDYVQSIQFHSSKALPLAEKLEEHTDRAESYGAMAHAYTSLKEYEEAKKLCEQGLSVLRRHPDASVQLAILNALGIIYREQGQLQDALNVNQTMYALAQTERKPWYEAHGVHAIGLVYKEMGDMTKALDYHEKALMLSRRLEKHSVELEGNILVNIADIYIRQKKWPMALTYCTLAKQTAVQVRNSGVTMEADEKLYQIYKNTGETLKALNAYENVVSLKDSVLKEENKQRIQSIKDQYANEQKLQKQEVQLYMLFLGIAAVLLITALLFWNNRKLQVRNRAIDRQRTLLETAREQLADINKTLETRVYERTEELVNTNRELLHKNEEIKKALFKGQTIERRRVAIELHDNLSSLLSAVNMSIQSINPKNLSESEQSVYQNVRQLIQNAYAEVRNISHNILPAELEREGLGTTLTTLVNLLKQNSGLQFSLKIIGLTKRLPVEIEFNVYSIVLELINNAVKHAKATNVAISLRRTNVSIDVSVTDDGVGLGRNHNAWGVGRHNIQTRLDSLGGTFNAIRPAEKGTRIRIKIPVETASVNGNVRLT